MFTDSNNMGVPSCASCGHKTRDRKVRNSISATVAVNQIGVKESRHGTELSYKNFEKLILPNFCDSCNWRLFEKWITKLKLKLTL